MDFRDSPDEAAFRAEVRGWLDEHLTGRYAPLRSVTGPADEDNWDLRVEWERLLGADRWVGLSWPQAYGGRGADVAAPDRVQRGVREGLSGRRASRSSAKSCSHRR